LHSRRVGSRNETARGPIAFCIARPPCHAAIGLEKNPPKCFELCGYPVRMQVAPGGAPNHKEPKLMLRGKSSLFALLVACLVAAAWSGVGMAEEITHQNVGTMAANAKTAQDYEALANYYEARAKMHKEEAEDAKAQYEAIHKPMGKRTGSDQEVIATQETYMKQAAAHYLEMEKHSRKLAAMYHQLAKSAGGGQ
jgi:hypothetical protein